MEDYLLDIKSYGLDQKHILEVAIQLAPELFAALRLGKRLSGFTFPIQSDSELNRAAKLAASQELAVPGVVITPASAIEGFQKVFLPVIDDRDLLGNIYLSIVINHKKGSRERRKLLNQKEMALRASHDFSLED